MAASGRWTRDAGSSIERLYRAALAQPAADRARYLVEACGGHEALRCEVASLLESSATADGVFAALAAATPPDSTTSVLIKTGEIDAAWSGPREIVVVQNWDQDLKRLVPVN